MLCLLGLALVVMPASYATEFNATVPDDLESLEVIQKLDGQVPLDLAFVDERGHAFELNEAFTSGKPVLLTLVYYRCPMLCNLVLSGLVKTLKDVDLEPGEDFEIVTVSIDPREKPLLARQNKQGYLKDYGRPGAESGWHFLTGPEASSSALAEAVGFPYRYLENRDEYAHPASVIVLTPEGRISQYLDGVSNEGRTARLAMIEASKGAIGNPLDQLILYCYQYDASEGRYAPVAMRIMQVGGFLTLLVLGTTLVGFWRHEVRTKRIA